MLRKAKQPQICADERRSGRSLFPDTSIYVGLFQSAIIIIFCSPRLRASVVSSAS
jgi:hypothetical protein